MLDKPFLLKLELSWNNRTVRKTRLEMGVQLCITQSVGFIEMAGARIPFLPQNVYPLASVILLVLENAIS